MNRVLVAAALAIALAVTPVAGAQPINSKDADCYNVNVPPSNAAEAITSLARQTGAKLLFPYDLAHERKANAVVGCYALQEALTLLLAGSGLTSGLSERGITRISLAKSSAPDRGANNSGEGEMKAKKNILTAAMAFLMSGGVVEAIAQDDIAKEARKSRGRIEEVVVTATKREQNLQNVPISITALTGDQLEKSGITDLQSLSLAVPGLLVAESGTFQRRISIRGIGNIFGSSSLVGMYLDETSVASAPANQIDLRVFDLERVEVLKGPQGTLYGEGSVGGTIRYVTKDPELDSLGGSLELDASSIKDGSESQEIRGIANIPLLKDTLGLRIAAQYNNFGGWIDQPALDKEDINDYELYNVRTKLLWRPIDKLDVEFTAITHRNDVGAQNTGEDEDGNYTQALNDPSTPTAKDDYDFYSLLLDYDWNPVKLVSSTGFLDSSKSLKNLGNQCCNPTGTPGDYWDFLQRSSYFNAKIFTQELRVSSSMGKWYWTTGLYYKDAEYTNGGNGSLYGVENGTPGVDFFEFSPFKIKESSESTAIFGEAEYRFTEKFLAGLGFRYFKDDREYVSSFTGNFLQQDEFKSTNPKVYLSYFPSPDFHIYANMASGFRSGGFNSAGEPTFDPEDVRSYEVGIKLSALDGGLSAEFALFYSQYQDYQIVGIDPVVLLNVTANAGDADIKGVDFSLTYAPVETLELGISGNYMDTEFKEINVTGTSHAVGDPVDLVPEYGVSIWANYSFNWSGGAEGFFRVNHCTQGKSYFRNWSIGSDYVDTSDVIDMLNARLGWEKGSINLELYAVNLLNERGLIGPLGIEKNSARAQPRTVGVTFGYSF